MPIKAVFGKTHFHHRCSIVCNRLLAIVVDKQQVTSVRTESALDRGLHRNTGINVRNNLTLSLRCIRPYPSHNKPSQRNVPQGWQMQSRQDTEAVRTLLQHDDRGCLASEGHDCS